MKKIRCHILSLLALWVVVAACVPRATPPLPPEKGARPSETFQWPLKSMTVLSRFGARGHRYHTGIDLRQTRGGGDPVLASRAGVVTRAQVLSGYGRLIEIRHADGFATRYAHLRKFSVKVGEKVQRGEKIGIVGSSGRATTAHLHFEILTPRSRFVDPAPYLFPAH